VKTEAAPDMVMPVVKIPTEEGPASAQDPPSMKKTTVPEREDLLAVAVSDAVPLDAAAPAPGRAKGPGSAAPDKPGTDPLPVTTETRTGSIRPVVTNGSEDRPGPAEGPAAVTRTPHRETIVDLDTPAMTGAIPRETARPRPERSADKTPSTIDKPGAPLKAVSAVTTEDVIRPVIGSAKEDNPGSAHGPQPVTKKTARLTGEDVLATRSTDATNPLPRTTENPRPMRDEGSKISGVTPKSGELKPIASAALPGSIKKISGGETALKPALTDSGHSPGRSGDVEPELSEALDGNSLERVISTSAKPSGPRSVGNLPKPAHRKKGPQTPRVPELVTAAIDPIGRPDGSVPALKTSGAMAPTDSDSAKAADIELAQLGKIPERVRLGWPMKDAEMRGGVSRLLNWFPKETEKYRNCELQFTSDDGRDWSSIAKDIDHDSAVLWTVPVVTSKTCRLRIVGIDNRGKKIPLATSDVFSVDSWSWQKIDVSGYKGKAGK
jgi:hypothetical protein